ncbi:DUF1553 domain-containing protein [Novipirellula aureliae]|nr:PSD1 and planctomycete cytochrome C domain-containing protein [Novipirellula aureliae]
MPFIDCRFRLTLARRFPAVSAVSALLLLVAWGLCAIPCAAETIDFAQEIRPLLSDRCFACHGPDEAARRADLRLDLAVGLDDVVSGENLDSSELVARITSDDPGFVMPPPDDGKRLSREEVAKIRQWLAEGAVYETHWSFIAPQKESFSNTPLADATAAIDFFVDREIERAGLTANGPADDRAILRRVCLDLTGLPPSRGQLENYLRDRSNRATADSAYERLVDSLLASHHFGEHVGRYWLDLVRFGDTHGLHLDNYREMWPYRDWVINAINDNMPLDQFITEQLAGDLLPDATVDQKIASGFNRLNVTTNEAGSIYDEIFARNVIDRTDAFGTVFLGMTVGCSSCHDHKFDPITIRDYYSMSAYFNSLDGRAMDDDMKNHAPSILIPTAEQAAAMEDAQQQLAALEDEMNGPIDTVDAAQLEWEQSVSNLPDTPIVTLGATHLIGPFPQPTTLLSYDQVFASQQSAFDPKQSFEFDGETFAWTERNDLRCLDVHSLGIVEDRPSVTVLHKRITAPSPEIATLLIGACGGYVVYLNGDQISKHEGPDGTQPLSDKIDLPLAKGNNDLYIKLVHHQGVNQFSYAFRSPSIEVPPQLIELLRIPKLDRSEQQSAAIQRYYRSVYCTHPDWTLLVNLKRGLQQAIRSIRESITTTLVWKELAEPKQAYVLDRGQYDSLGESVERRTPSFLPGMLKGWPNDRLGLAKWLVSETHPLTSRVAVNRYWQQIFGTGLVKTSEDFGSQGSLPSHPELLDWLSVDFRESGWNVKQLFKAIVMSNAYRRSAETDADQLRIDPNNRLLARGPRFRLDAEVLRDQALALSCLLVDQVGGPSVRPPQPAGLWKAVGYSSSNTAVFVADSGDNVYRRSVYMFWKRTSPPPQMTTFDAPSRESCTARRERTNTPLQALVLLNETQYMEAAKQFANRVFAVPGLSTTTKKIDWAFETITMRPPTMEERQEIESLIADLTVYYENHLELASQLSGDSSAELAAWIVAASTLLNLDEVLCK